MPKRPCIVPGCPALTTATRCTAHQHHHDQQRNAARPGHRAAHRQARTILAPAIADGTATCYRCGQPVHPDAQWDADNTPQGWAVSHATCNRAAGGRR